ncbi:MAG TPA: hypothetical protein VKP14_07600, partial [Gaiellaceae bacterium]|nr:hypothetical protein [Gaiellaceae bacterium]
MKKPECHISVSRELGQELAELARRIDRPMNFLVERAWRIARKEIVAFVELYESIEAAALQAELDDGGGEEILR